MLQTSARLSFLGIQADACTQMTHWLAGKMSALKEYGMKAMTDMLQSPRQTVRQMLCQASAPQLMMTVIRFLYVNIVNVTRGEVSFMLIGMSRDSAMLH